MKHCPKIVFCKQEWTHANRRESWKMVEEKAFQQSYYDFYSSTVLIVWLKVTAYAILSCIELVVNFKYNTSQDREELCMTRGSRGFLVLSSAKVSWSPFVNKHQNGMNQSTAWIGTTVIVDSFFLLYTPYQRISTKFLLLTVLLRSCNIR